MRKELKQIIEKLDTLDKNKAFGELIAQLIESNISVSDKIKELSESISQYSEQSSKNNRILVWLTVIIAFSALISSFYYFHEIFN